MGTLYAFRKVLLFTIVRLEKGKHPGPFLDGPLGNMKASPSFYFDLTKVKLQLSFRLSSFLKLISPQLRFMTLISAWPQVERLFRNRLDVPLIAIASERASLYYRRIVRGALGQTLLYCLACCKRSVKKRAISTRVEEMQCRLGVPFASLKQKRK